MSLDHEAKTIRVFSPEFPYPPRGGSPLVILNQILDWVDQGKRVELVVWKQSPAEVEQLRAKSWIRDFPPGVMIRNLQDRISHKSRTARILGSLISSDASTEVNFYPDVEMSEMPTVDLEVYHYSFAVRWLRQARTSAKKRVVYFHNLESDLALENAAAATALSVRRALYRWNAKKMTRHERALVQMVDEVWVISPSDLERVKQEANGVATEKIIGKYPVFPGFYPKVRKPKNVLGFIGALDFLPNQLSLKWIIEEVAPKLSERKFAGHVYLIGKGLPPELEKMAREVSFIKITEPSESLESFWSSLSFLLVPDLGGSGVRMKLLEALWRDVPVIANSRAAERLDPALRSHPLLFVSDDPKVWVDQIFSAVN